MSTITCILLTVSLALAQPANKDMRIIVEQALDQPTKLTIENAPLYEALQTISQTTGMGLSMSPEAINCLPYGDKTKVSLKLENIRLREGIQAICNQLGMAWHPTDRGVFIVPTAAMERLGRPASWEELRTLSTLMTTKWNKDNSPLKNLVRFNNREGENHNWEELDKIIEGGENDSLAEVLSRATGTIGCTWFPWGENVIVIPQERQTARRLERIASLRFTNNSFAEVLRGLSRQAGVDIKIDPAAAAQLPPRVKQNFSLLAEGVTIEEALQQISIATGLAYEVTADAIFLSAPVKDESPETIQTDRATQKRDRIVGKVVIPSEDGKYQYEWMIRESDLSEEENHLRQQLVEEAVKAMKADLIESEQQSQD